MAGGYDGEIRIRTLIENGDASSSLLQLESRFQKLTRESQRLTDEMRQMERQKIPTDQYKDLQNTFDSLVANGRQLSEKLKNTEKYVPTRAYKEAEAALDRVSGRQAQLNHRMQEWVALGRNTDSVSYRKMQMEMADCERESDRLIDALNRMEEAGQDRQINDKWKDLKNQMRQVGQEAAQIRAEMMRMENENAAYIDPRNTEEYQRLAARLREVNEQLNIMNQRMRETAERETETGRNANGCFGTIQSATQQASKMIEKFIKRIKKIALTLIVFQWVSKVFRAMIESIQSGIQNYAKYSNQFNQKMSEMKSSALNLKNSIGAAAIPIVSALTPAITVLCNWLTNAINLFNKFISALTGKKTWSRAKKQQVDYAASLDNTADAAKKAKGALQGFDELNVISSNDSGGSSGGSGSSGDGVGYEEVPLTEKDFAWIEKIKKAFEAILPVVVAIGAALLAWKIATFLSDLMKVHPILGTILSILAIIAGLALAIYSYFRMWNEGVDWQGLIGYILGVSLAFGGLYALFGPLVAGIFLIIASAAGLILALKDISENGLNAKNASLLLVSAIGLIAGTFLALGTTVGAIMMILTGGILAAVSFVDMLNNGFSWMKEILMLIGIALMAVGAIILGAPALVTAIIAAIVAVVLTLVVVIKEHWEEIKEWFSKVGDWVKEHIVDPVKEKISDLWTAICDIWGNVSDWVKEHIVNPVKEKITELWTAISKIWGTVSEWFSEHVIEPIVAFFEGLKKRVGQIFEGLWIIIQAIWIIVSGWFNEHVIEPVVAFFKDLWEKVSTFFKQLWEDIKAVWNTVSEWFSEHVTQPVVTFFKGVWDQVSGFFKRLWEDIKTVWSAVSAWFNVTVIDPVKNAWKTATEAIGGFFKSLWEGIQTGVVNAMNAVIGGIESAINFIVGGINNILGGFNKVVSWAAKVAEVDWGGVDLVPTVTLPRVHLANGGITTGRTFAEIGEAGREAVLPLENNLSYMKPLAEMIASEMKGVQTVRIVADEGKIFKIVKEEANDYYRRTGNPAFDF
nr:MAG TPA: minor tail protein [Bacteriophage sp.]